MFASKAGGGMLTAFKPPETKLRTELDRSLWFEKDYLLIVKSKIE